MDIKQVLPLLFKGKLGEKEKALLTLGENPDPAALGAIIEQMYTKAPRVDLYATLKKIMPADVLGRILKYFECNNRR